MKYFILMFSLLMSFSSCNNVDIPDIPKENNPLIGTWNLIEFSAGFSPLENYNNGEIVWEFKQDESLNISIDNSISSSPIKSNGNYRYSINGGEIIIENSEFDYELEINVLIISDDPSSDGFRAEFLKRE